MKFIFEVRMKPGYTVEEYAEAWLRASEIIQRTLGARNFSAPEDRSARHFVGNCNMGVEGAPGCQGRSQGRNCAGDPGKAREKL